MEVTEALAGKVLETVNAGLVSGMGVPKPGQMCVEAAVCYAMGLPHSDQPTCVGEAVRRFKIRLNDAQWSNNEARTNGLRLLAIAQLGSDTIDQNAFRLDVAEQTIRRILPIALRAAAKMVPWHHEPLEAAAVRCEEEGTVDAARAARSAARDAAAYAAYAYADAAAAYAAYAYADAAAAYAAYADAAYADAAYAYAYAAYADAAYADAAYAYAAYAAYAADAKQEARALARDRVLNLCAEIGLNALKKLNSPGCKFLYLAEVA